MYILLGVNKMFAFALMPMTKKDREKKRGESAGRSPRPNEKRSGTGKL